MRTDKYMMAKAWMKQDQAPQSEALDTWNTLEAEFNDERKAMLMASAETDAIKEAMNKKYGSGTIKYGSEIPQPEIKTPQAAFEFSQRNPAAEGGRIAFGDGSITPVRNKSKNIVGKNLKLLEEGKLYHLRLGADKKVYFGTKKELETIFKNRKTSGGDVMARLEDVKNPKGYLTQKQFQEFLKKNNINAESSGSSFAKNHGVNTKVNPLQKNALLYDTSQFTEEFIETVQKAQVKSGVGTDFAKNKFPPKPRNELNKIREDQIEAQGGIKKNSPFAGKKKLKVDLGHTGDYKTELITGNKLAYTPADVNFEIGKKGGIDDKIRAVKKKQEKALATLEGDELKKILNETDATLTRLADQTKGFKSVVLSNGKKYGGERLTIDPFNIYPGKTEVEIKDIQKEYLGKDGKGKKIITEGPNKTSAAEIQKIQDAVIFEKNRKSNLKAASKIGKKEINNLIKVIGCPNFKAAGGRIEFESGGDCFDKGTKLINSGMKGATPAAAKNFTKFANTALRYGKNIIKFGIIPEAIYVGAETAVRMGMGDSFSQASKQALGFYLDPILGTNFKKEGAFSKMEGDVGTDMAFDVARLNEYKESLAKLESIKSNKENVLATNDESLTGQTDQEVTAQYDKFIAKAEAELNKRMLSETERIDFENKADTAKDVAGVNSPIRQFIGNARNNTELMRVENDPTGMQSDMIAPEVTQKDLNKKMLPQKQSNMYDSNFMKVGQLPLGPRLPSEMDLLAERANKDPNKSNSQFAAELKQYQDYLKNEKNLSFADQARIFGKEQTYGTQGNFFGEKIKQTPMYDYAEGGITGLRSKYEYKK